jgi:hypothetical protein
MTKERTYKLHLLSAFLSKEPGIDVAFVTMYIADAELGLQAVLHIIESNYDF